MAKKRRRRRQRQTGRVVLTALAVLLVVAIGVALMTVRTYMRRTGTDFRTALQQTVSLGLQQLRNLMPGEDAPVPVNPYQAEDYYVKDGLIHCAVSPVSRVGIDVSSHQGQIDWTQVRGAGVDYAVIRVGYRGYTDGELHEDSMYYQNIEGALAAGLDVGVYFFSQATSTEEARKEAMFVLDRLGGYDVRYPVYFDWEGIAEGGARTDGMDGEQMTRCAIAFCDNIETYGYTAGVYFNQSYGYSSFRLRDLLDYEFWLAEYQDTQSFLYEVQMWQYTYEGSIPGVDTIVDLNLCYHDYLAPPVEGETGEAG